MTQQHPDIHSAAQAWSEDQVLHVAACYSNPFRWRARRELANDFRRHMEQSPNVKLYVVELAYGTRPFEVTSADNPNDLQLRTTSELFHKENLQNLVIARKFPQGWQNGACIDMDFHFTRHDWALEAVHQLQHHPWVQLFSSYSDLSGETLGTGHRVVQMNDSFAYRYTQNNYQIPEQFEPGGWSKPGSNAEMGSDGHIKAAAPVQGAPKRIYQPVGATGGAWSFTRAAFDGAGGLLDRCILGHGDWFMTFGLVGATAPDMHQHGYSAEYQDYIRAWQERACRSCNKNIGYVDCHALHHWHGPKNRRGYSSRDTILVRNQYSPVRDVYPDWQGVLQLTPDKPRLRDDIRAYFLSRSEDITSLQ